MRKFLTQRDADGVPPISYLRLDCHCTSLDPVLILLIFLFLIKLLLFIYFKINFIQQNHNNTSLISTTAPTLQRLLAPSQEIDFKTGGVVFS